jgi:hypothetical protein
MFLYTQIAGKHTEVKRDRLKIQGAGCKAMRLEGLDAGML